MKTLMYPIAPDDDFPEMFCAIRQGSGEHLFYTPERESASWMLFRTEVENARLQASNEVIAEDHAALCEQNAKLRELAASVSHLLFSLDVDYCTACPRDSINNPCPVYTVNGGECLYKTDLRELGVEVPDE